MRRAKGAPPAPWIDNGWTIKTGRPCSWTLMLPGAKGVYLEKQEDGTWRHRPHNVAPYYDPKLNTFVRPDTGPFATANEAARDAEKVLAIQLRASLRRLKEIRA